MKKRKIFVSILTVLLVLTSLVGLTACDDKNDDEPAILNQVTVINNGGGASRNEYYIENFNISMLKLNLQYQDGTKDTVTVTDAMLDDESKQALVYLDDADGDGKTEKNIKIKYNDKFIINYTFVMTHDPNVKDEIIGVDVEQNKVVVYDGVGHDVLISCPDNIGVKTNNEKQTNVGEYPIIVQFSKEGFKTKEVYTKLTINPKEISRPTKAEGSVYKEGKLILPTLDVTANEYSAFIFAGDKSATEVGKYTVEIALSSDNFVWKDSTEENKRETISLDWEVTPLEVEIDSVNWLYNADGFLFRPKTNFEVLATPTLKNNISINILKYCYLTDKTASDPQNYTITNKINTGDGTGFNETRNFRAKVKFEINDANKNNYIVKEHEAFTLDWKIYRNRIDGDIYFAVNGNKSTVPVELKDGTVVSAFELEYNGEVQYPKLNYEDVVQLSEKEIKYKNHGGKNATRDGEVYTISVSINKKGYEPFEKSAYYVIKPKRVGLPTITEPILLYNGKEQYVDIKYYSSGSQQGEYHGAENEVNITNGAIYGIEPNDYEIEIALNDTSNYVWDDEQSTKEPKKLKWSISKITLPDSLYWATIDNNKLIYEEDFDFTYVGIAEPFGIDITTSKDLLDKGININKLGLNVEYLGTEANSPYDTLVQYEAGTYKSAVKVTPMFEGKRYTNYDKFFKGAKSKTIECDWEIKQKEIDFSNAFWSQSLLLYRENPSIVNYQIYLLGLPEFVYLENLQINPEILTVTGNAIVDEGQAGVVGNHTATIETNKNYKIVNNPLTLSKVWEIKEIPIGEIVYIGKSVPYDKKGHELIKPTFINPDDEIKTELQYFLDGKPILEGTKLYAVNDYKIKVVITKSGFSCIEKEIDFSIKPQKVVPPAFKQYMFNGYIIHCGVLDEDKFKLSEEVDPNESEGKNPSISAKMPGKYYTWIALKDEKNYVWADDVKDIVDGKYKYSWEITKLVADIDSIVWDATEVSYNESPQGKYLANVPTGINSEYVFFDSTGKPVSKNGKASLPIIPGTYKTKVVLSCEGADDITLQKISEFNNNQAKSEYTWQIKPMEVDCSNMRWSINDDERPAIYGIENGKEVANTIKLINIPIELTTKFTGKEYTEYKPGTHTAIAVFNDKLEYYNLKGLKFDLDENGNKLNTITFEWKIIENNLDWINFNSAEYVYTISDSGENKGTPVKRKPEYEIRHKDAAKIKEYIEDASNKRYNVSFTLISSSNGDTEAVNVGVYQFKTIIEVEGYAKKEEIVTITITPMAIERPTIDTVELGKMANQSVIKVPIEGVKSEEPQYNEINVPGYKLVDGIYYFKYVGLEYEIPIIHKYEEKVWTTYYRIDEYKVTSPTKNMILDVKASLINSNFIWKDSGEGNQSAETISLGLKWRVVSAGIFDSLQPDNQQSGVSEKSAKIKQMQ